MQQSHIHQLHQLFLAHIRGVHCGDLIDKCSTRELVREGLARNTGGSPSSLDRVYITREGRTAYMEAVEGRHSGKINE